MLGLTARQKRQRGAKSRRGTGADSKEKRYGSALGIRSKEDGDSYHPD